MGISKQELPNWTPLKQVKKKFCSHTGQDESINSSMNRGNTTNGTIKGIQLGPRYRKESSTRDRSTKFPRKGISFDEQRTCKSYQLNLPSVLITGFLDRNFQLENQTKMQK